MRLDMLRSTNALLSLLKAGRYVNYFLPDSSQSLSISGGDQLFISGISGREQLFISGISGREQLFP